MRALPQTSIFVGEDTQHAHPFNIPLRHSQPYSFPVISVKMAQLAAAAAARVVRPLKDSFSRVHTYLRLSLTERCSLRCVYCMPADGVDLTPRSELLTAPEMGRIASLFASRGVDKIRLTGGEPLVRADAVQIAQRIGAVSGIDSLGITTNGLVLARKLPALLDAGVRHFNVSLDTLVPAKFELITRRPGHARVWRL